MYEIKYNYFEVLKHVFTHKSLVNYGYQLIIVRILYSIIFPFICLFKVIKNIYKYEGGSHEK